MLVACLWGSVTNPTTRPDYTFLGFITKLTHHFRQVLGRTRDPNQTEPGDQFDGLGDANQTRPGDQFDGLGDPAGGAQIRRSQVTSLTVLEAQIRRGQVISLTVSET